LTISVYGKPKSIRYCFLLSFKSEKYLIPRLGYFLRMLGAIKLQFNDATSKPFPGLTIFKRELYNSGFECFAKESTT